MWVRAQKVIPGGVNSPVRAFKGVGGEPLFFDHGLGCRLWSEDGVEYIDYVCSWGAMILGHADCDVQRAVNDVVAKGFSFGAPTVREVELAEFLCSYVPSMEMVRLTNSGTEANMAAVRLARGYTGRNLIIKFAGCYHGHLDCLLVSAGSGLLTFGTPSSAGVTDKCSSETIVVPYNDVPAIQTVFDSLGSGIACCIVEAIAGNMNLIIPSLEWVRCLRSLCTKYGSVLIFDEVMTGFRSHQKGAQGFFGVEADLVTLGKVVGGGYPLAACGGSYEIMKNFSPLGPVYQAGTLSGNPSAVSAGLSTLKKIFSISDFFDVLSLTASRFVDLMIKAASDAGYKNFSGQSAGGMFGLYFRSSVPTSLDEVKTCNEDDFRKFFHLMLKRGVYFAPSAYEAGFISAAHNDDEVLRLTYDAACESFDELVKS
ncbi:MULTISPECIES: glutamate-1-semialdehyde 2,1-aminomutase [Candidatus Ichthyocystis]|uniref:Glutamate-1-semialdehyde 2,1-aminomutase n=1 Tax=Candidatus Ichthyocystis hellenicum TaxID=1561003 RepID=A0A0S4M116_9BURK|nr:MULTISPECIES: glutamate-1-semialdehyde 2,1-aminomutase [Ichthyocystis]CUT17459.1 Glutamate-1-semialdehyde 2,1-aminomutase [Candidatus Ichthyocystis hellenicum]